MHKVGAQVVLSKLPIGDLATQWFADRGIFCAGRVPIEDLIRVSKATGAVLQTTVNNINESVLGTCGKFEEKQIGAERYNLFEECPNVPTLSYSEQNSHHRAQRRRRPIHQVGLTFPQRRHHDRPSLLQSLHNRRRRRRHRDVTLKAPTHPIQINLRQVTTRDKLLRQSPLNNPQDHRR